MAKSKTKTGFEYELNQEALNDYELLEDVAEVDNNPLLIPKVLELILGKEQTRKLKDHIRDKNGRVPATKMMEEIADIFSSQQVKN